MKFNFIFKWSNFSALLRGYPTFVISIAFIGANTAIIGDVAGHLGCFINLKDGVNAIAFVALGTSVPGKQPFPALSKRLLYTVKILANQKSAHSLLALKLYKQKYSFLLFNRFIFRRKKLMSKTNNPPFVPAMANGYITFVISIAFIGACTAVIGDVAGHLGCFINLKDGVNAIAFVALGTSVPGTKMSLEFICYQAAISFI